MRYAGLIENDFVNGIGVCVSIWMQGCPYRCKGCHNPSTWDDNGGMSINEDDLINKVVSAIGKNGIKRNLSILGGEPLYGKNPYFLYKLLLIVRTTYPNIAVFLWTGAERKEIEDMEKENKVITNLLELTNVVICGRFDVTKRDVSLPLVGSSNQEVIMLHK